MCGQKSKATFFASSNHCWCFFRVVFFNLEGIVPLQCFWRTAALHEVITSHREYICFCTNIHNPVTVLIPPYVGNDYFCDTASESQFQSRFHPNDLLWDGQGCGRLNTCCSFNNPPWFMKELPSSTSDDIEMRLCADQERSDEGTNFESVELYVQ